LEAPNSTCNARKRIFSQSDVDLDQINERKKINPFSSALSAAPYYFHDFAKNSHDKGGEMKDGSAQMPLLHLTKPFKPHAQPYYPSHKQSDIQFDTQSISNFSGACGIPTYSESLTMNDGKTAQGNEVSNWKTNAPEFVPKGLNHLAGQGQLPSQLSHLPVNATAETAFLKLTFRHQAGHCPNGTNSYLVLEDQTDVHNF
jgi:hypothetical protein